ncbi:FadR/GntR family transcriptional regulator [Streptomyces sp. NPDC056352]|uniref:FadR/GntR family transcriptional regulator n=1 Tax=Streptomyces sp. NPDC056352 TaxID=3345791 RepID=UPI0035D5812D
MRKEDSESERNQDAYRPGYAMAAERILEHIEHNGLGPGDRLPTEAEFAALLGVSRSIARDALKTLAATGRITTQRGRGIFVAEGSSFSPRMTGTFKPTNVEDIMMAFEFRAIQEKAAAELAAARSTPAELMTIEQAVEAYADQVARQDSGAMARCDAEFHAAVASASHNQFLIHSTGSSMKLQREVVAAAKLQRTVSAAFGGFSGGLAAKAVDEHRAIYEAIRRGDAAAAGQAALAHLERTKKGYQAEIGRRVFQQE